MKVFIASALIFSLSVAISGQGTVPMPLGVGERVAGRITPGEKQVYVMDLPANRFVYAELHSNEVDSAIHVSTPDGEQMGSFDAYGALERFHLETPEAGKYRIEVSIARGDSGQYALEIMGSQTLGSTPNKRLNQLLKAYYREDEPGGVVAVFHDGDTAAIDAIGLANLAHRIPFTVETSANVGSISKQFTGFAIALLAKEGRLSVGDDVRKYLPELSDYGAPVTLLHLLNHTSGYRDVSKTFPMKGVRGLWLRKELIESARIQRELQNSPGSEYRYSNTGYLLLAEVIERVTGMSFAKWMKANVFDPLRMKNTTIITNSGQVVRNSAQGYRRHEGEFSQQFDLPAVYGASSVYSTVSDLIKWLQNFRDARVGGREVISQMSDVSALTDTDTNHYSYGLEIDRHCGLLRYSHSGSDGGIRANLTYYPDVNAGVILLFNERIWPAISAATEAFVCEYVERSERVTVEKSEKASNPEIDPALLRSYVGRYRGEGDQPLLIAFVQEGSTLRAELNHPSLPSHIPLWPVSSDTFVRDDLGVAVTFDGDTGDQVMLVTFRWQGQDFTLRRLPPWKPSQQDLQTYTGLYYSTELGTLYAIVAEEGQLKLRHPFANLNLTPNIEDSFRVPFLGECHFKRADDGTVSGFVTQSVSFERLK